MRYADSKCKVNVNELNIYTYHNVSLMSVLVPV